MITFSVLPNLPNLSSKSPSLVLLLNPKTPKTLDGSGASLVTPAGGLQARGGDLFYLKIF